MTIYFNTPFINFPYFLRTSFEWTSSQTVAAKIALGFLSAYFALYYCLTLENLRQRVTVIDTNNNTYTTHIKNVNGIAHVTFDGLFASQAEAKGNFSNGQLKIGKISFKSGAVKQEQGIFDKGRLIQGKKEYSNGMIESGIFEKGLLEGKGKRIYPDQTVEKGMFRKGKKI